MNDTSPPEVQAGAPAGQPDPAAIDTARDRLREETPVEKPSALPIGTVETILAAPSDLVEKVIDVPEWGCAVKIKSLTAAQSAKVRGASIDMSSGKPVMNWEALENAQFRFGVAEPTFKRVEVTTLQHQSGPGFQSVITALDKISGTNREAVKETLEAFQESGRDGSEAE